ncbi:MAG TPA: PadR family transcriptional regulator [Solirubrobacteraceae bacterium]|jgi:DNA-binding PadR family transcriptional regulator|nr:PadR family transcriptional regulator [Solirubrobacteraceae bacterium]
MARLSTSSYAVLGLLSFARMSGYDLAAVAQRSVVQVWPISKTQVYAELRRLSALALIEGRDAERSGGPAKTLFELTPAGERELDTWLAADSSPGLRLRAPAVLKLLLGHRGAPDQARAQLAEFRGRVSERLVELEHLTAALDANPDAVYAWATAQFGVRVCEAIVSWIDEVNGRLPKQALAINPRRRNPRKARALMDSLRGQRR